jgi:energy-coupling factor transporter ATP-binding protein EcfA2
LSDVFARAWLNRPQRWPIFRGRDRLIQDILTILADNHFVSVIGPSGSGKSSLVRAGVLATLERRHSRMGVRWRTATVRPGASPLWSMADGMLRSLRPDLVAPDGELPAAEVAKPRVLIDAGEDGLAAVAQEVGLQEDENFLLLVDQFEEIFRYRSDHEDPERTRLIEVLLAVANNKPSGIHIITTMRSEYLGDCARFKGLAETLSETHYLLPRMSEDELRQAIIEPAELKNGRIEDALIERLVEDIRGQEDELPILQHTLPWMWTQEEERQEQEGLAGDAVIQLGLADDEQLEAGSRGGNAENVKNALSRHGNRILEGMSTEERQVAEIMLRRMVEVDEHSNRLRRPTQRGTVARLAQVSLDVVQRVARCGEATGQGDGPGVAQRARLSCGGARGASMLRSSSIKGLVLEIDWRSLRRTLTPRNASTCPWSGPTARAGSLSLVVDGDPRASMALFARGRSRTRGRDAERYTAGDRDRNGSERQPRQP